jgi:SH3-like domain-containing protein
VPTPAERAAATAPANPPTAAPRAGVQQVAPYATPNPTPETKSALGKSAPGKARAKKPAPAKGAPAHPAPTPTVAAPLPAPVRAAPPAVADKEPPAASPPAKGGDPGKGSVTGLPLPRWASLRSDEVNLRSGPGTRYPIEWEYRRRDLPVQIEREFEVWRLIEDQDGVKGWVHQATLMARRGFIVVGAERVMRRSASDDAAAVARLKPGVVGRFRACDAKAAWCEVQVQDYRGWLKRDEVYGVYPGEPINP